MINVCISTCKAHRRKGPVLIKFTCLMDTFWRFWVFRGKVVLGYTEAELRVRGSGYQFIHAADMLYCAENHVRSESPPTSQRQTNTARHSKSAFLHRAHTLLFSQISNTHIFVFLSFSISDISYAYNIVFSWELRKKEDRSDSDSDWTKWLGCRRRFGSFKLTFLLILKCALWFPHENLI